MSGTQPDYGKFFESFSFKKENDEERKTVVKWAFKILESLKDGDESIIIKSDAVNIRDLNIDKSNLNIFHKKLQTYGTKIDNSKLTIQLTGYPGLGQDQTIEFPSDPEKLLAFKLIVRSYFIVLAWVIQKQVNKSDNRFDTMMSALADLLGKQQ